MSRAWGDRPGRFYVIQLCPADDPRLLKLGWTVDVHRRLVQHRSALKAPGAEVLRTWPCSRGREHRAIGHLTGNGNAHVVHGEVYRCRDLDLFIQRADALFEGPDIVVSPAAPVPKVVQFVTAQEVTKQLGIPRYALYRLVDVGKVPAIELPPEPWHVKDRRRLRFRVSEVRAALDALQGGTSSGDER